jgi:palmitoyl transferase
MKNIFRLLATAALSLATFAVHAEEGAGWFDRAKNEVVRTWDRGTTEYYATFRTWHLPWAYTEEQNKQYQNWPPGLGIGRGYYDEKGNWHGLVAIGFQDSHFKPEWAVAYGWKTYWQAPADVRVGLGYMAGLTARTDIGHYTPVPLILPAVSAEYGKLAIEGVYVPGGRGYGNVLLMWAKWHTDDRRILGMGKP